jgi:tetratricopeptide (TPR) repeat protein
MSFTIKRGLFQYDLTDHHAVLGLPVTIEPRAVRKRYLKLARMLHPDTLRSASHADKQKASQLLSKLVNPAYEALTGKSSSEHQVILEQTGKRLASEGGTPSVNSELAKALFKAPGDPQTAYLQALKTLAAEQYQSMADAIERIETLSELNLIFLMKKAGQGVRQGPSTVGRPAGAAAKTAKSSTGPATAGQPATPKGTTAQPAAPASPVDNYVRRAQEYMTKKNFAKAILELRDGLKIDAQHSTCHGLLGLAYLQQNQMSMAKVHITKALQSNPRDPIAIQGKEVLEKKLGKPLTTSNGNSKSRGSDRNADKSGSSGRFGGLFGNKKK